jgi:calcineurin-like phosphoesterase family protein
MEEQIIYRWNSVVKPTDIVYLLGHFGDAPIEKLAEYRQKLKGKICFVRHADDLFFPDLLNIGFDAVASEVVVDYKTWEFTLTAAPKEAVVFAEPAFGMINLHGHVAGRQRVLGSAIDVSGDAWDFTPIQFDDALMEYRKNQKRGSDGTNSFNVYGRGKFISADGSRGLGQIFSGDSVRLDSLG